MTQWGMEAVTHFADEESEIQRGEVMQGHRVNKGQGCNKNQCRDSKLWLYLKGWGIQGKLFQVSASISLINKKAAWEYRYGLVHGSMHKLFSVVNV
jgi:hypothetical protein